MPGLVPLIATACVMIAVPLLVWAMSTRSVIERRTMLANLERQLGQARDGNDVTFTAAPSAAGSLVTRAIPKFVIRNLDKLHARAGRPSRWPMERILVYKIVAVVVGLLLAVFIWPSDSSVVLRLAALLCFVFVTFLPELLLGAYASRRRERIALALPDTMDQLSIAVEAGLGFEAALRHVSTNTSGPLADEIVRTLQDMQVGVPRRAAYQALSERVELPELRRFLRAIIQAEQHGISIARVLSIQASEMRVKRRQRAEEKAMRIPVLVAFPLFVCIFPALLVVVLGPALINIIDAFSGGGLFNAPPGM